MEKRRPVSFSILQRLINSLTFLCASDYEGTLFKVSFCLSFFGALKVGELLSLSQLQIGGLQESDVVRVRGAICLRIRRSKTDIFSKGKWILLRKVGGLTCPVIAVDDYLAIRPAGWAFLINADGTFLTRFQYSAMFRKALGFIGESALEFGTHSFRIGAATEAALACLSVSDVQRIGRWRSASFAGYVRPD